MEKTIRTIFMGTPDFAVPGLERLLTAPGFEVVGVYTQPDKPVGRKQILTPPPIKTVALRAGLPIFQPEKIKTEVENIQKLKPDLIVVIAYGKIIPQAILDIPQYGCVNVHASLLPRYRGAACLQAPILNGDTSTGITIMKMDAGMDTGPILKQVKIELAGTENLQNLHDRLSQLGADNLIATLQAYCRGEIKAQDQDASQATYVSLVKKEDGHLNPQKSALELERQVRACQPWPGTYLLLSNQEHLKILEVAIAETNKNRKIGEIYLEDKNLYLSCGQNSLHILKLQRENRTALQASDFLKGNSDIIGLIAN